MKNEVKEFFESLINHKRHVMEAGEMIGGISEERLFNHDASKFTAAEYPHYARQFYGDGGDPPGFARAWLNHIHLNDHHWEHWIFGDGYSPSGSGIDPNGALPMPEECIREMVADWMGSNVTYRGSWDMSAWFAGRIKFVDGEVEVHNMVMHSETVQILMRVLGSLGYQNLEGVLEMVYTAL